MNNKVKDTEVEKNFNVNNLQFNIDDGLHSPKANLNVLIMMLPKLKVGGWYVVEDVHDCAIYYWQLVSLLLPKRYDKYIIRAKEGNLFVITKSE